MATKPWSFKTDWWVWVLNQEQKGQNVGSTPSCYFSITSHTARLDWGRQEDTIPTRENNGWKKPNKCPGCQGENEGMLEAGQ